MTDKKEMPADGGGIAKGKPDGVSGSPDNRDMGVVHGRAPGGESGGAAYPNPHSDDPTTSSEFSGGQGEKAYYGGENPNAVTPRDAAKDSGHIADSADPQPRPAQVGGRTIDVVEQSGVAAAESTGKVGTDAAYEREQESPGGG